MARANIRTIMIRLRVVHVRSFPDGNLALKNDRSVRADNLSKNCQLKWVTAAVESKKETCSGPATAALVSIGCLVSHLELISSQKQAGGLVAQRSCDEDCSDCCAGIDGTDLCFLWIEWIFAIP